MMGHAPTAEGVARAYVDTLVTVGVATSLPMLPSWPVMFGNVRGFVVIDGVVGGTGRDTPLRVPVVSVSTWAAVLDSDRPQYGAANSLAEDIVHAVWAEGTRPVVVQQGPDYDSALVQDMTMPGEPRRIADPDTGRARFVTEIQLGWTRIPTVIP
jgi:hypothetical protein